MRRVAGVFYSIAVLFAGGRLLWAVPPATNHFRFRMPHEARYRIDEGDLPARRPKRVG